MIKEFDSFRTDDEGTFYYYKDKNGVENQWSYNLDELEYYIKSNEEEIKRLTKRLEEAQLGYLRVEEKNKRLNNIIKILEKYVIDEQISEYGNTLEEAKEYLEKLKRS